MSCQVRSRWWFVASSGLLGLFAGTASSDEPVTLANVQPPPAITADEPKAKVFSFEKATRYMDVASLDWQKTRKCGTCHTNFAYLMIEPGQGPGRPAQKEIRSFFEEMVESRWDDLGPRWPAEVVCAATNLAFNDRLTTGKLHPATKKALDRMWTLQRQDGGWDWLNCGWPPMEMDDHFGVTFAALAVGVAPGDYAKTEAARKGLEGIRKYLKEHPAPSAHHRAMLLWASLHVKDLLASAEQKKILDELMALQLPEGGWAIAGMLQDWQEFKRKDDKPQDLKTGDGYATGLAIYLARQMNVPAADPRISRGIAWLKTNQRESGRWFTRSPTKDSKHFISNVGTAFAIMAIDACEPSSEKEPKVARSR